MRAAFRELHGARLHGFALLVTLGDRPRSARLTAAGLAAGSHDAARLRHPERAAAWLRAHVVRHAGRRRPFAVDRAYAPERQAGLRQLGVDAVAYRGLAALRTIERAALIASEVERLDPLDVATVLACSEADARRTSARARRRYVAAAAAAASSSLASLHAGALAERVAAAAKRAFA